MPQCVLSHCCWGAVVLVTYPWMVVDYLRQCVVVSDCSHIPRPRRQAASLSPTRTSSASTRGSSSMMSSSTFTSSKPSCLHYIRNVGLRCFSCSWLKIVWRVYIPLLWETLFLVVCLCMCAKHCQLCNVLSQPSIVIFLCWEGGGGGCRIKASTGPPAHGR